MIGIALMTPNRFGGCPVAGHSARDGQRLRWRRGSASDLRDALGGALRGCVRAELCANSPCKARGVELQSAEARIANRHLEGDGDAR